MADPSGEWDSRFCSISVKFSKYSIVEYRYKHHSFAETACSVQTEFEGMLRVDNVGWYRS